MPPKAASRRAAAQPRVVQLNVAVLHDNTEKLKDVEGGEAHVGVWEAILPVEESLRNLGHRMRRISLEFGISEVVKSLQEFKPNVVFHLAETAFGDTVGEARVAGLLELLNIPHTSASPDAVLLCRDKLKTKAVLRAMGISTPPYAVSFDGRVPQTLPMPPWISKPSLEDGSIGISTDAVTSDPPRLRQRVQTLFKKMRQPVLIESYIDGREINIGVVGDEILPLAEISFAGLPAKAAKIVNYESKWKYDTAYFKGTTTLCPAPIDNALRDRICRIGRRALAALNVRGYSRIDMRMDRAGQIYILEVNPNPDLSPIAGMAKMAEAAGWQFDGLIAKILNFSIR